MDVHLLFQTILDHWHIITLFFLVAVLYASVGFGGGSSYLAILALTSLTFTKIRAIALLCNIAVVFGNVLRFHRAKLYDWHKVLPLVIVSVPLAFLGGKLRISETAFFVLLGCTLLFASITMWFSKRIQASSSSQIATNSNAEAKKTTKTTKISAFYGGFIGFISGLVGIGGGIFLAPLLHLTHWSTPKKISATASFFILANSVAGLFGQSLQANFEIDWQLTSILLITVFIGGQIGGFLSNKLLSPIKLKKATAILIAFVSLRILYTYLF